jgi:hypothetical protein
MSGGTGAAEEAIMAPRVEKRVLAVPDAAIADLRERLVRTRLPDATPGWHPRPVAGDVKEVEVDAGAIEQIEAGCYGGFLANILRSFAQFFVIAKCLFRPRYPGLAEEHARGDAAETEAAASVPSAAQ